MYEGEINMVIHAKGGEITVEITPQKVRMILDDVGPGIPDIERAMQEGYSTAPDEVTKSWLWSRNGTSEYEKIYR